jgi:hypothetical protein
MGADRARVAFKAKVPFLRYYHERLGPIPPCQWDGESWLAADELVHHLVRCDAMPVSCAGLLVEAKAAVRVTHRHGATVSETVISVWGR